MRILSIDITNFLGIEAATFPDLKDIVIIAGENGSGKSCVFDAVRLLKSVYGGYRAEEVYNFFGERNIDIRRDYGNIKRIAFDKDRAVRLEMNIALHKDEIAYSRLVAGT